MMWRTHFVMGVASLLILTPFPLSQSDWALAASGAALGALLPDLDASESKIRHFGWRTGSTRIEPLLPISVALNHWLGHRGFLHSVGGWFWCGVLLLPFAFAFAWLFWLGVMLGFGSHLFADGLTKSGIPLWQWRLSPTRPVRRVHLLPRGWRISTGSQAEELVFAVFAALSLFVLLGQLLVR